MDGINYIDLIVLAVLLISGILAYVRGFVREMTAIAAWVLAFVLAFAFAGTFKPIIMEVPVLNDFLGDSCELSMIASFIAVLTVSLVILSFFAPLLSAALRRSNSLSRIDQTLGFTFGVLRGALLVAVGFLIYDRVTTSAPIEVVDESLSADVFASIEESLEAQIPDDAPGWIVTYYEDLVSECAPSETALMFTYPDANTI